MKKPAFICLIFFLFFSTMSYAQKLEKYKILFDGKNIQSILASGNGEFLAASFVTSNSIKIYDATSLELLKTYEVPDNTQSGSGSTNYGGIGSPSEMLLFADRYLAVLCYGGYVVHIDLLSDKLTLYKASGSLDPDSMYGWSGA